MGESDMRTSSPARRSQAAAPPADASRPGCTQQKFQPVWLSEASTHLGAVVQDGERVCIFHVPKPGKMSGMTGDWLCPSQSCGLDLSSPISEPQFLPQWAPGSGLPVFLSDLPWALTPPLSSIWGLLA